jgi:hypothetical protein
MKPAMPGYFDELLAEHEAPCISVYLPTVRLGRPENANNHLKLEDQIKRVEQQLRERYKAHETETLVRPLRQLLDDHAFWEQPASGLAIFASPDFFHVQRLDRAVPVHAEVANSFHLKPLIRSQQFTGKYQVLCLAQRNVRLFEGNQDRFEPVELRNVPRTTGEALSIQINETLTTDASAPSGQTRHDAKAKYQTTAEQVSVDDNDLERFFRIIDQSIWDNHSRAAGLPIILCALEKYQSLFRSIAKNPNLVPQGIVVNPDAVDIERLRTEAWQIIEPYYQEQVQRLVEAYQMARARQQGSEDLRQVAEAATFSRVGTLLVDADKHVGGRIDPASGHVEFGDTSQPDFDDLLDDIAEKVIKTGGQVMVMPSQQMPTETGVAAIYRF